MYFQSHADKQLCQYLILSLYGGIWVRVMLSEFNDIGSKFIPYKCNPNQFTKKVNLIPFWANNFYYFFQIIK